MGSSSVPAKERKVGVWSKRTEPGGGWRKDREQASHSRQRGHIKVFWDDDETERDRDVTNRGFPHQRYKPSKPRPTSTESSDTVTPTVNEAGGFPTVQSAKRGVKQVRSKGENWTL